MKRPVFARNHIPSADHEIMRLPWSNKSHQPQLQHVWGACSIHMNSAVQGLPTTLACLDRLAADWRSDATVALIPEILQAEKRTA